MVAAAPPSGPPGEADAQLAAAQEVAVQVAAGALRRGVVGVLDEGVALALARGVVGGEAEGADGADELAGVEDLLVGGTSQLELGSVRAMLWLAENQLGSGWLVFPTSRKSRLGPSLPETRSSSSWLAS